MFPSGGIIFVFGSVFLAEGLHNIALTTATTAFSCVQRGGYAIGIEDCFALYIILVEVDDSRYFFHNYRDVFIQPPTCGGNSTSNITCGAEIVAIHTNRLHHHRHVTTTSTHSRSEGLHLTALIKIHSAIGRVILDRVNRTRHMVCIGCRTVQGFCLIPGKCLIVSIDTVSHSVRASIFCGQSVHLVIITNSHARTARSFCLADFISIKTVHHGGSHTRSQRGRNFFFVSDGSRLCRVFGAEACDRLHRARIALPRLTSSNRQCSVSFL